MARPVAGVQGWFRRDVQGKLRDTVGGAARLRVIVLLACVLALDSADKATIGATASNWKRRCISATATSGCWRRCLPPSGRSRLCRWGR
jgi:hypothetical protein